jgi:DNA-binding SARP family transcriptional activator/Tfp pilus assembly protein PilF
MIELRTLGTLDVRASDGRDVRSLSTQPKRLALFVYLALAGSNRLHRRDTVVAAFWPDLDQQHARGALRQALSFLRRVLGDEVIVTRGEEEIGIAPELVRVDVQQFEQASRDGKTQDAIALYHGDFLNGFFVSATAPAFDEWVDRERFRLRGLAAKAIWTEAETCRTAGDHTRAVELARRAASFAPESEAELARLVAFLDESGDRAAALAAYDEFARRLDTEYEAEPSPETRALIDSIRARTRPASRPPSRIGAAPPNEPQMVDGSIDLSVPRPLAQRPLVMIAAAGILAVSTYLVAFAGNRSSASRSPNIAARGDSTLFHPADTTLLERPGFVIDERARILYIRARYWWGRRGRGDLLRAVQTFQEALDIEPTYAAAYSGMGDAYAQLGYGGFLRPDDAFPKAKTAALRALELDSAIAEPHATLGFVAMYYDWDWIVAEREYRRALKANERYATAHEWFGLFLAAMGRFKEAQAEAHRALELDPLSIGVAATAGWVEHYSGNQAEAERQLRIALRTDSNFAIGHLYLGRVLQFTQQYDSALSHFAAMGALRAWVPSIAGEGYVYAQKGERARARATLRQLDSLARKEYVTAYAVALVHAALAQPDSAFAWLDKAVDERTHWLLWLNRDRRWDPIREDPRFRAISRRVGVPD